MPLGQVGLAKIYDIDAQCEICEKPFQQVEERWTHLGRDGSQPSHNPFHEACLQNLLSKSDVLPLCPSLKCPGTKIYICKTALNSILQERERRENLANEIKAPPNEVKAPPNEVKAAPLPDNNLPNIDIHYEAVLSTNMESDCGICLMEFTPDEQRWTHEDLSGNGQRHPPFHAVCLLNWLDQHVIPTCPVDQTLIDRASLVRKTYSVFKATRETLTNLAYSASIGAATAGMIGLADTVGTSNHTKKCFIAFPIFVTGLVGILSSQGDLMRPSSFLRAWSHLAVMGAGYPFGEGDVLFTEKVKETLVILTAVHVAHKLAIPCLNRMNIAWKDRVISIPVGIYAGIAAGTAGLMLGCDPTMSLAAMPAVAGAVTGALTWKRTRG